MGCLWFDHRFDSLFDSKSNMVFDCSTCSITCSKTICRLKTSSVNKEGCFTVFKLMYTEINIMIYKIPAKIHCQYQSIAGKNLHENKRLTFDICPVKLSEYII